MFDIILNAGMWLLGFAFPIGLLSMILLNRHVDETEEVK